MSRQDLLAEVQPGDLLMYNQSTSGLYLVNALHHPLAEDSLEIQHIELGHRSRPDRPFDYRRNNLNDEFHHGIYRKALDRKLALVASLLLQANVSGDISEIHDLLTRIDL